MVKCWAQPLGNCGGDQSREHLISGGIFKGETMTAEGFPWCLSAPKEIGVKNLTANILCRDHNSQLSPLDQAGIHAFDKLAEIDAIAEARVGSSRNRHWTFLKHRVDGASLERWFAKSMINLFWVVGGDTTWWLNGKGRKEPPEQLIRFVFGAQALPKGMGLYGVYATGDSVTFSANVNFAPVLSGPRDLPNVPEESIVAGFFGFGGFKVLFWLFADEPRVALFQPVPEWRVSHLIHHPAHVDFNVRGNRSQRLSFRWEPALTEPLTAARRNPPKKSSAGRPNPPGAL